MKKTRIKILEAARMLFNKHGVADVSLRKIAREIGLSHSNLIYYFKTKNELIEQLHMEILTMARAENERLQREDNRILGLKKSILYGFSVLYDYRFFMLDLPYIMKENDTLQQKFLEVEKIRADMYEHEIRIWIEKGWMREEEYLGEFDQLIKRIRIFSDSWLSSAQVYGQLDAKGLINTYSNLFMSIFYPYLTQEGKNVFLSYFDFTPSSSN